jgi:hypothetical protein
MALVRGSDAGMALLPNFSNTALTSEAYKPDMHSSESYVASSHGFRVSEDIDGHEIEFTIERVAVSLDHLVGGRKQLAGHGETECLRLLEVDHQLKFRWPLDRQVGWLFASQYPIDVGSCVVPNHGRPC